MRKENYLETIIILSYNYQEIYTQIKKGSYSSLHFFSFLFKFYHYNIKKYWNLIKQYFLELHCDSLNSYYLNCEK